MSLSPFSRDDRPSTVLSSSQLVRSPKKSKKQPNSPLTLSQALIITAGLAGLIGLLSGGFMRFFLSRSSNARFLSPLQTFPALSNWSSSPNAVDDANAGRERDANAIERWEREADLDWETGSDFDEFSSEGFTESPRARELTIEGPVDGTETLEQFFEPESALSPDLANDSIAPSDFDAFADRKEGRTRVGTDPLKSLSEGPLLRKNELNLPLDSDGVVDDENFFDGTFDENLSEERF